MRFGRLGNPVRDESAAFRLVFVILAATALVVLAAWISPWLGALVFLGELAAAGLVIRAALRERASRREAERSRAPRARVDDTASGR